MARPAVLFVCLGNICRSPLAEAAFRAEAARRGLDVEIDSAGIGGWHVGQAPDIRARAVAQRHGIDISGYRARKVTADDFRRFDYVIALDRENLAGLKRLKPADSRAEVRLFLDYVPGRQGEEVEDPYYGTDEDFDITWEDVCEGARALADRVSRR